MIFSALSFEQPFMIPIQGFPLMCVLHIRKAYIIKAACLFSGPDLTANMSKTRIVGYAQKVSNK